MEGVGEPGLPDGPATRGRIAAAQGEGQSNPLGFSIQPSHYSVQIRPILSKYYYDVTVDEWIASYLDLSKPIFNPTAPTAATTA